MWQLFELPEEGSSCNWQNSTVDQYKPLLLKPRRLVNLRQFTTEQAKIRRPDSVHLLYNTDVFSLRQRVIWKQGVFLVSFEELLQAQICPTFTFSSSPWWRRCYKTRFKYSPCRCLRAMACNIGVDFVTSVIQSRWQNKCAEWNLEEKKKKRLLCKREKMKRGAETDGERWERQ